MDIRVKYVMRDKSSLLNDKRKKKMLAYSSHSVWKTVKEYSNSFSK